MLLDPIDMYRVNPLLAVYFEGLVPNCCVSGVSQDSKFVRPLCTICFHDLCVESPLSDSLFAEDQEIYCIKSATVYKGKLCGAIVGFQIAYGLRFSEN